MRNDLDMVLLQPQFDDGLREILESIEEKYHAGICMDHPENECFHHCPTNQHFLLDHTKRIVWAAQIVRDLYLFIIMTTK